MTSLSPGADLLLYIATSSSAVSASLVEERMVEGSLKQLPIYFISEALNRSKLLYSEMEKMAYAVVMVARKFRYYFQSCRIKVPTFFPFGICLRIEKPKKELENGQRSWHCTPLILSREAQSSPRSWQTSLLTGHHQHLRRALRSLKQFGS